MQKYKSLLIFIVKLVIICGAYYIVSDKISDNQTLNSEYFIDALSIKFIKNPLVLFSILLFTFSNWVLEIFKWKNLVSSATNISFYEALKQSLSSLTASLLTPNRIGEYGAKAIFYPKFFRYRIVFLNFWGNFTQMWVTLLFGLFGCLHFWQKMDAEFTNYFLLYSGSSLVLSLVLWAIFKKLIRNFYIKFIRQFKSISSKIQFLNLSLSVLRYLIFSHQFYLLLIIFGADINYETGMKTIFAIYLVASLIPGFIIFDWLIKGSVAVTLFGLLGIDEILVLSVTSIMWILNFAFPSILGTYFVFTFDKFKEVPLKENSIPS